MMIPICFLRMHYKQVMQFHEDFQQQPQIHSLDMGHIISIHHVKIKASLFPWDPQQKMSIAFVHVNLVFLTVPWHINVLGYNRCLLMGGNHAICAASLTLIRFSGVFNLFSAGEFGHFHMYL